MAAETGDHFGSLGAVLLFFFALTKFENPQKIRQATVKQNPILFALSNGALRARRGGRGAAGAALRARRCGRGAAGAARRVRRCGRGSCETKKIK